MNLCSKYVCVSSCSNYLPFEVCEFPTSMYCDTMDLVGTVRGQGLAHNHGLVPNYGLVQEISGCLLKSVIFHKSN